MSRHWLILVMMICAVSCQRETPDARADIVLPLLGEKKAQALSALNSQDYGEQIAELHVVKSEENDPRQYLSYLSPSQIEGLELTEGEQRIVGVIKTNSGKYYSLFMTTSALAEYAKAHEGVLPASGAELSSTLMTDRGLSDFEQMSKSEALDKYLKCINLVTGRFYESFQSESWTPGGLLVEALPEDEVKRDYSNVRDAETKDLPTIWRVRVYGEKPNTVLVEKTFSLGTELITSNQDSSPPSSPHSHDMS